MKILRNPWVVGVLVVVALALVAGQFMPAHWPSAGQTGAAASAAAPGPAAPAAQAPAQDFAAAMIKSPVTIDSNYILAHITGWAGDPHRDPFLLAIATEKTNPPVETLKLEAIWRQTGGNLAVINHGIYAEGDEVEGYKLEKIEDDQVWLRNSTEKQHLGFAADEPATTNPPAPAPSQSNP